MGRSLGTPLNLTRMSNKPGDPFSAERSQGREAMDAALLMPNPHQRLKAGSLSAKSIQNDMLARWNFENVSAVM